MDSARDQLFIWTIFGTLMVLGLLAGAVREWQPRVPRIAIFATIAGFLALLAVTVGWVAACPGCTSYISYDSSRPVDLMAAFFGGGLFTFGILLFIRLGSALSSAAQWLLHRRV